MKIVRIQGQMAAVCGRSLTVERCPVCRSDKLATVCKVVAAGRTDRSRSLRMERPPAGTARRTDWLGMD